MAKPQHKKLTKAEEKQRIIDRSRHTKENPQYGIIHPDDVGKPFEQKRYIG